MKLPTEKDSMSLHKHHSIWCAVVSDLGPYGTVLGGFHTGMVGRRLGVQGKLGGDTARTADPS